MHVDMELEVRRAQRGDHEAFVRLMRQWERQLYRIAQSIVKREEDCADAMQETVIE
ncbi:hypothetical protein [Paenibacillus apiarius]|uniref:hypothetical protein n=1 Tax=Paenibacillus apiarius TaxID=46240 RepID=UPI00197CE8A7|nr:hypothetical protein [Paenibacillus apiarius]MBN3524682.1 hypothetical protein [Paenibacillus apiarius]